jgi:hypothetical protein
MNGKILFRIIMALLLLIAAAAAVYLGMRYFEKKKLQPALERYEASGDPAEIREFLLRSSSDGNSAALLEFGGWSKSHKQQFFQIVDGFSDVAQRKQFGKSFAEALVNAGAGDDFIRAFADGNSEVLNIIRADIVRTQNAKKK